MPLDSSFYALRRKLSKIAGTGKLESLAKEGANRSIGEAGRESLAGGTGGRGSNLDNLATRDFNVKRLHYGS